MAETSPVHRAMVSLARSAPPAGARPGFVRAPKATLPEAPAPLDRVEEPARSSPSRGWLSRAGAWSLAALSLVGAVGLGAHRAVAADPAPASTRSRVVEPPAAGSEFLLAPGGLPEAPAEPAPQAFQPLPAPTALSRARVDRVEINARIEKTAEKFGVPADLVKAVAWQESTWTHARQGGELTRQANLDPATGEVRSVDSGIMQINDQAHPKAYPRAHTLDGNLEYGSRFLRDLIERHGEGGIWRYNGDPAYALKIARHLEVQPWRVPVLRDHLRALRAEEAALRVSIPKAEKSLVGHQGRVEASRGEVERLTRDSAPPKKLAAAVKTLETRERKAAEAQAGLERDRARLEALPGEIAAVSQAYEAEVDRVTTAEAAEYRQQADALAGRVAELEQKLQDLRGQAAGVLANLRKVKAPELLGEVQGVKSDADALRGNLGSQLSAWRTTGTRLRGTRKLRLGKVEKELDQAFRAQEAQRSALRELQSRARSLRTPVTPTR